MILNMDQPVCINMPLAETKLMELSLLYQPTEVSNLTGILKWFLSDQMGVFVPELDQTVQEIRSLRWRIPWRSAQFGYQRLEKVSHLQVLPRFSIFDCAADVCRKLDQLSATK